MEDPMWIPGSFLTLLWTAITILWSYCATQVPIQLSTTWNHAKKRRNARTPSFFILTPKDYQEALGDAYEWATRQVPFIDLSRFPPDDARRLATAYYYRWQVVRKHLVYTSEQDGWIVTEFLPDVPWAGKHNTIPAAAGHHIREGRWLHSSSYMEDYIAFWASYSTSGANPFSYTQWIADSAWERYLLTGGTDFMIQVRQGLADMWEQTHEQHWHTITMDDDKAEVGCYWQSDGADAMEVSISGNGCRPTLASSMHGNALAISHMFALDHTNVTLKNHTVARKFAKFADRAKRVVLDCHWNAETKSFAVIPTLSSPSHVPNDGVSNETEDVQDCHLDEARIENQTVTVRELLGFMPFYFTSLASDLVADVHQRGYLTMYQELTDPLGYASPWGLRTAELRSSCYNYSWEHGDCWNGPSWPYETSRILTGMANVLEQMTNQRDKNGGMPSTALFYRVLVDYARQHTDTYAINDTAVPPGSGHVFENLHPDLGYWNNRQRMYWNNDTLKNMGNDYFHSTFNDIILSGLFGIRPLPGNGGVRVLPNVPRNVTAWAVDHLRIRNRNCAVVWDRDGSVYGVGTGLSFLVDGRVVATGESQEGGLTVGANVLPLL